ncbi:SAM-dependent methyltransferase [Kutzneria sp. NPDC052558]|uniref:SAM-dependent methyltransferase n=1 Tax=Kutzneria sp. NPDC052558 TaxID=3364121 RepID=UPI0037C8C11E
MGENLEHPGRTADSGDAEFTPEWLTLREPVDAAARSTDLVERLVRLFAGRDRLVIRDLGCGTGSMGRWLSPLLPNPQHWIMQDREPDLLGHVYMGVTSSAPVTVETRLGDLGGVTAADLAGTSLVTASALLDILTAGEVDRLAAACVEARVPALFTLSVLGEVELSPAEPFDADITAAFNEHQRRVQDGRRLLGPDAPAAIVESFEKRGASVQVAPSPWQLGGEHTELTAEWLRGWVGAAVEQRPELTAASAGYLRQRLDSIEAGRLTGSVGHVDVLAVPA